jgi:lipopolysaccharide export LptBFGC system permease protein LptF
LILSAARRKSRAVRRLVPFFVITLFLCAAALAQEKKRFVLYAALTEDMPVQLADGAKWMMDKGDTFPIVMFKEQQTKVILQLAGTSFIVPANKAQVIEEKDVTAQQLASYRQNVANYLDTRAEKWKAEQAK